MSQTKHPLLKGIQCFLSNFRQNTKAKPEAPLQGGSNQTALSSVNKFSMEAGLARAAHEHKININTVIDVGASDGKWSLFAQKFFPEAHFLLFEPLKEREEGLNKLKAEYGNIDYVLAAAGSEDGETYITVTDDLDGSGIYDGKSENKRLIPITTIDTQVKERNLSGPFLLKLDSHGFELPILSGAKNVILQTNLLIIEVYNFKLTHQTLKFYEMCLHLESLGFRCYDMVDPMLRAYDKALWQMDFFFLPIHHPLFNYSSYK